MAKNKNQYQNLEIGTPKIVDDKGQKSTNERTKKTMNRQNSAPVEHEQWRINLKELRNRTGMSNKQIADKENLSEKSVSRVFSGEAKSPGVDLVRRIIHALGGAWSEIFGESGAVIGSQDMVTLQDKVDRITAELAMLTAENAMLKDKANALQAEADLLRMKIEHKDELLALHNYYIKYGNNN